MVDKVITCLCIITALSNASFSLIAPFYPLEVKAKGIDVIYIGFLMGTQALTFIFSSFITGRFLHKIGRSKGMIIGVLLIIASMMGLGSLKYVHDKQSFILFSFLWKFMCGLGAGINSTSSMAIIASHYKEEREKTIGMMESSSGIGLLIGPFFGAILYQIGGYVMPFFIFASMYFCIYPLIAFTLAKISEAESLSPRKEITRPEQQLEMKKLFKVPRFFFGIMSQILVYGSVTFLQPTLALHLEQFGYTAVFIGFSFAIPTLIYAATSPLIYVMTSKIRKTGVIFIGYTIMATGMFLVGPSKLLGLYNSPAFIVFGLAIVGFGCGMIIIPVLPDMIESIEEVFPDLDETELHNNISGIFIASQGLGETLGPMLGSTLQEFYGFRQSQDTAACTLICYMIIFFIFCGRLTIFKTTPSSVHNSPRKSESQIKDINEKGSEHETAQQKTSGSSKLKGFNNQNLENNDDEGQQTKLQKLARPSSKEEKKQQPQRYIEFQDEEEPRN